MNQLLNEIMKAAVMGFLVPALLLSLAVGLSGGPASMETVTQPTAPTTQSTAPTAPSTQPSVPATQPSVPATEPEPELPAPTEPQPTEPEVVPVTIRVIMNGESVYMDLEEYVLGVMLAEMPASFDEEALKAQAVASRTYTLKCCTNPSVHSGGAVCTNSKCCHGYTSPEGYIIRGGKWTNLEKIRKAVEATAGQVLTYKGSLILSTYFSCSGGTTEDALEVWGLDYPYLQSVPSQGEEDAPVYANTVTFSSAQFAKALGKELTGSPDTWFGEVKYTQGKGVLSMVIGGEQFDGTALRTKLGLRSTVFTISVDGDAITIHTKGYGHRVGMSQYGAEAMALAGKTYAEILDHYYVGTVLAQYAP